MQKRTADLVNIIEITAEIEKNTSSEKLRIIAHSIANKKFYLLKNKSELNVGYVLWADVNEFTILANMNYGYMIEYQHEWNEGEIMWILDISILDGNFNSQVRSALRKKFKNRIIYYRKSSKISVLKKGRNKIKIDTNKINNEFFIEKLIKEIKFTHNLK